MSSFGENKQAAETKKTKKNKGEKQERAYSTLVFKKKI